MPKPIPSRTTDARRGSRLPSIEQGIILKKYWLDKQSVRSIARETGRHRSAVQRVLTAETIRTEVLTARSELLSLLPDAVDVYRQVLKCGRGDLKVAVRMAISLITMMAVALPKGFADSDGAESDLHDIPEEQLEFMVRNGRSPTDDELSAYAKTGEWPKAGCSLST